MAIFLLIPHSCKSRFCPTCGKHATDVWANQVLNNLLDLPYHQSNHFLKHYPLFASMTNKLWNLTWYAYIGAPLLDPRFSIQYIGRYTKRAVMAEYRTVYYAGKIVRFSYKDYAHGGKTGYLSMKVYTFIGRLIRHIPDKDFPLIRHAGLFANRWEKKYLSPCRIGLNQAEPDDTDTILKVLIQMQKSGGSNQYCNIPVCQHSMSVGHGLNVKNSLISNKL